MDTRVDTHATEEYKNGLTQKNRTYNSLKYNFYNFKLKLKDILIKKYKFKHHSYKSCK